MLPFYLFKYAITGIQFDNKKNNLKLINDVGNKTKQKSQIFGKTLNF